MREVYEDVVKPLEQSNLEPSRVTGSGDFGIDKYFWGLLDSSRRTNFHIRRKNLRLMGPLNPETADPKHGAIVSAYEV